MNRKHNLIVLLILLIIFTNCKSSNSIKDEYKLTRKEYKLIRNRDSILTELANVTKDSIPKKRVKRSLDSFFKGVYSQKELVVDLQFCRVFNGSNFTVDVFKGNRDSIKVLKINSFEELKQIKKIIFSDLKKNDIKIIKKDSLN